MVEHQPSKLRVAGSSLVSRSKKVEWLNGLVVKKAWYFETLKPFDHTTIMLSQCSSGVEHFHGKEGVKGSIPFIGSLH